MQWVMVEYGMEFGWFFIAIFSLLFVFGVSRLVNPVSRRRERETHGESPIHILKRRYAKGEITKDEFEIMKNTIAQDICKK